MGNEVTVSLIALDGLIERLAAFSGEVDEQLGALEREVDGLHANWSGGAAAAHAKAHAEWAQGAQMMAAGIQRLHQASANAHNAFRNAVRTNREMFS